MYVRDQHWLERPQPQKVLRTVQTDRTKEILVAADTENAAPDLSVSFRKCLMMPSGTAMFPMRR